MHGWQSSCEFEVVNGGAVKFRVGRRPYYMQLKREFRQRGDLADLYIYDARHQCLYLRRFVLVHAFA
jgi:hypothetical protein